MTLRAQTPLVRGRSNSENLTFSALLCEQIKTKSVRRRNKKHGRKNSGSDSKRQNITKTVIAAKNITFCIKPLTHYLRRSDLKIGEIYTIVTKRKKLQQNFIFLKTFGRVKKVRNSKDGLNTDNLNKLRELSIALK